MKSSIYIEATGGENGTQLSDLFLEAPYKIMSPFYDRDTMQLMQMCACPGLFGGDHVSMSLHIKEQAKVEYLTQSYEKIFPERTGKEASRITQISLGEQASLRFLPKPVIPFANSSFSGETVIRGCASSTLQYSDIVASGRVAMNEQFQMERYENRLRIYIGEKLVFFDHMKLCPAQFVHSGLGHFGTYTHCGMLYCYSPLMPEEFDHAVRDLAEGRNLLVGVSRCEMGYVIRTLADRAQDIQNFYQEIRL